MSLVRAALILCVATLASFVGASSARAATDAERRECASSYQQGQLLRRQGDLLAARQALLTCASAVCGAIHDDCVQWVGELERATPSLVPTAHDASGQDIADTSVRCDGVPWIAHLDGRAVALNPGAHTLRFEANGFMPAELRIIVVQGEQSRAISAQLVPLPAARASPSRSSSPSPSSSGRPWTAYVLGAVGGVALASFVGLAASGYADYRDLSPCRGHCAAADVDAARLRFVGADVSLGVTITAIVGLGTYFIVRRVQHGRAATRDVALTF